MNKTDKELLLFYINDKANSASKLMELYRSETIKKASSKFNFYYGQYLAFSEMYSFVTNIHPDDE